MKTEMSKSRRITPYPSGTPERVFQAIDSCLNATKVVNRSKDLFVENPEKLGEGIEMMQDALLDARFSFSMFLRNKMEGFYDRHED